ncbi:alkyldihydroxyacetonephosphate synthase, peroxisomal-like isoform X2 [Gordionus sp. m RMFG-2023]
MLSGYVLSSLKDWVINNLGINMSSKITVQEKPNISKAEICTINVKLVNLLENEDISYSLDFEDCLFRAHGHTLEEIYTLRTDGTVKKLPDIVVWPKNHNQVKIIVDFVADFYGIDMRNGEDKSKKEKDKYIIIPFGGGTSVTEALICPENDERIIISLDTSQMAKILWINEYNLTARVQAGIIGQELNFQLEKRGFCFGHEPDSYEFSTLGGWIATRASGMKKNVYGNIENLVINIQMVTPRGVICKNFEDIRSSTGPDVHHFIMGSEGTLGVITEATIKIRPLPRLQKYGSVIFPNFNAGVECLREIAKKRCAPASIRLVDNAQFILGQALKPSNRVDEETNSNADTVKHRYESVLNSLQKFYLLEWKKFDVKEMCAATLMFLADDSKELESQENSVYGIVSKHGGLKGGQENGLRGYLLTFVIAYIRDLGLDFGVLSESFETAVPWDKVIDLCRNVKDKIRRDCAERYGITFPPFVSCRVTQTYDTGACVYFYLAFNSNYIKKDTRMGKIDPIKIYRKIEDSARDEIIKNGGNLSHHHGIGKIRKQWMATQFSPTALEAIRALKLRLDPDNIFANGNLID